uniref:Uncharacterized protein n=1 Tax=Anguilla anguilla TaxID=7936 RepID=A0A0E9PG41_ANGAN
MVSQKSLALSCENAWLCARVRWREGEMQPSGLACTVSVHSPLAVYCTIIVTLRVFQLFTSK